MDPVSSQENYDPALVNQDPILMSMLPDVRIPIRFFETSSTCRLQPDSSQSSSSASASAEVADPLNRSPSPPPPETTPSHRPLSVIAAATDLGPLPVGRRRKLSNTLIEALLHSPVSRPSSITTIPEPSELEFDHMPRRARHMSLVPDSSSYFQAMNYIQQFSGDSHEFVGEGGLANRIPLRFILEPTAARGLDLKILLEREPELLPLVRRVLYMAPHWQPVLDELDGISRGVPAAVAAAAAANPSSASSLLLATFAPNAHTNAHSPPQLQSTQMQRRSRQFLEQ